MTDLPIISGRARSLAPISKAVHQNRAASKQGVLERLFSFAFSGLVYPQIWEDPVPDMEALALGPDSHLVTIASGGCNVLAYLTADPARITAVDLNHAHIALNELKLTALRRLPGGDDFKRFFQGADSEANVRLYDRYLAPMLSDSSRAYWEASTWHGRRITLFEKNPYRFGLLGNWIGMGHFVARIYGIDLAGLLNSRTPDEQEAYFEAIISPIFDKKLVRFLSGSPVSLYGLGIPPAQYEALAEGRPMADVLRERLGRLAAGFPLKDNYFAWQAFQRADRVRLQQRSVTEVLKNQPCSSVDGVVLLDAQDWMTDQHLNDLWQSIVIACRPGARIVFRTAGRASVLPGSVHQAVLERFDYDEALSGAMLAKDRSAIYGGFHLYHFRG